MILRDLAQSGDQEFPADDENGNPGGAEPFPRQVNEGGGDGYFACGGKLIPIRWQRDGVNSRFTYLLSDGTPLSLGRGTTYVCFLSGEDMAEYSEIKPE